MTSETAAGMRREMAVEVGRIVSMAPHISGARIAEELNRTAALAGVRWLRADDRLVRRLVKLARRDLAIPIAARPGGDGYWVIGSTAEAGRYAQQCRRMGRQYFAIAAEVLNRADLAAGEQFSLDIIDQVVATAGDSAGGVATGGNI